MSKKAHGYISAHETHFGGYFEIDGKKHPFSGTFDQSVQQLMPVKVILEYDDVKELRGIYMIGRGGQVRPVKLPLHTPIPECNLRICEDVIVTIPPPIPVSGRLAWLPKNEE